MKKTSCRRVVELLPLFVGGDVDDRQHELVCAHLRECVACRSAGADLQQATKVLRGLAPGVPAVEPPFVAMHGRIMTAVASEAERGERRAAASVGWRSVLAVAASLLVVVGFWLGRGDSVAALHRPALATPVSNGGTPRVVPWSGPRVQLQPLGRDDAAEANRDPARDRRFDRGDAPGGRAESGRGAEGVGRGIIGRDELRPLIEQLLEERSAPRSRRP